MPILSDNMSVLGAINYDPAVAVSKSCASLLAMTAIDTANLRLTFNAPASGTVLVRLRCTVVGATTTPVILLGVLEGSTIIGRKSPIGGILGTAVTTTMITQEATFVVTGLSAGSHVWDAAYGVEIVLASTNIKYGGPNDTAGADAYGGFQFEIYDAPTLLAGKLYDPSTAVNKVCTSLLAMTAIDTTNLRLVFTAPPSGSVLVRLGAPVHGATTFPQILFGVLDGSSVRARTSPAGALKNTALATAQLALEGQAIVTGLTPGNSYTWDAAYAVQVLIASTGLKYGGPNNATTNDAWGGFLYEIWRL